MSSRSVRDSAAPAGARALRPSWRRVCRTLSLSVVLILLAGILAGRPETPALAAPPPAISGLHASNNQILNALMPYRPNIFLRAAQETVQPLLDAGKEDFVELTGYLRGRDLLVSQVRLLPEKPSLAVDARQSTAQVTH